MEINSKQWMKFSISIWRNLRTPEEKKRLREIEKETGIKHPATFPLELCKRLILIYTKKGDWVLDPMMGIGTTLITSKILGRNSIGIEISDEYIKVAKKLLKETIGEPSVEIKIFKHDARRLLEVVDKNSIDLVITSPPYWDVHTRKRTADRKKPIPYTNSSIDLGNIHSYQKFLEELRKIFENVHRVLKNNKIFAVVVMDIRKGPKFYPFHVDCISLCKDIGFQPEDIVIWDRNDEYNHMKPLGYPHVFRVNKVHEYILLFKKVEK